VFALNTCSNTIYTYTYTAMAIIQNQGGRARDEYADFSYDLSLAVYGTLPTPPTTPRRSRASSPTSKASPRKAARGATGFDLCHQRIQLNGNIRQPKQTSHEERMQIHQSTCLNLNMTSDKSTESDLWMLPDFDDWEMEQEAPVAPAPAPSEREGVFGTLLRCAANSNLERLRTRLEGDGWDFVGGRYGQSTKSLQQAASQSQDEESVDDEFDVVVL
jgi:hypothetical protein